MTGKTKIKAHYVFVTKYRRKILTPEVSEYVLGEIKQKITDIGATCIAINVDKQDHIHIMLELKPTHSISFVSQILKQTSGFNAWKKFPAELRTEYWYKNHFWSDGYFCCTTGDASSETVKKYIEEQG